MHDRDPNRSRFVEVSSNRTFGLVFSGFFLIIGLLPMWRGNSFRYWALGVAAVLLVPTILAPAILGAFNRLWTKFGELIHRIVSPVALAVLFFCVVTPTGLLLRLMGKDILRLRFDKAASSYWISREPPGPTADSLKNQY
jgi:hypothetical protein